MIDRQTMPKHVSFMLVPECSDSQVCLLESCQAAVRLHKSLHVPSFFNHPFFQLYFTLSYPFCTALPNTISHRIPFRTEYHLAPNIISHRIPSRSTSCIIEASLDPGNDIIQYLTPPSTSIPKFRSAVSVPLINKVPAMSLNCGKRQRSPASTDHHHQRRSKSSIGHPVIADEMELDTVDIELSPDRVLVANTQPHNVQTQNFFTSESPHLSTASGIVCSGAHSCAQRKRPMWFMSLDSQKADIHNCVTCRILNNVHTRHKRIVGDDCLYVCAEKTIHALSKMAKKQLLRWKHQLEWHREDMDPVPSESAR